MTVTTPVQTPLTSTGDTHGQQWIGYPDADAWTATVTDERDGTTYVRHAPPTGPGSRASAALLAVGVLGMLYAETPEDQRTRDMWDAAQDVARRLNETTGRVEVASRLLGLRVALQPTDPHHPANT